MRKLTLFLITALAATSMTTVTHAQTGKNVKIYAIQFHADWCGLCKILDPKVDELKTRLQTDEVLFLEADLTNSMTKAQSRKLLDKYGLAGYFDRNNGTAFVLLVNAQTGKAITKLYRGHSVDDMYNIISENL